jgi:hypothetical protein
MSVATPPGAPYAPFMEARTARPPGLSPLDPADWVVVDPDYADQMPERDRLLADRPDETMARTPEAGPALAEFRAALLAHLLADGRWRRDGGAIRRPDGAAIPENLPTLALAGRLCQEDFLLLAPAEPEYRLIAGVLCFPSRWSLTEKLGRPMTRIHGPVPHYAERLARRVNRVFEALAPERPLVRVNWLTHRTARLDLPQREGGKAPAAAAETGEGWFLRTERQTLLRLPETRVVVFGVKTTVTPFDDLTDPQRRALRAALSGWDEAEIAYRGGEPLWRGAIDALG